MSLCGLEQGQGTYAKPGSQFWHPTLGHLAIQVIIGPRCESGQAVQYNVTSLPAAAVACNGAGSEPTLPSGLQPPHWTSIVVTSKTGPFDGILREIRSGYSNIKHWVIATRGVTFWSRETYCWRHVLVTIWLVELRCGTVIRQRSLIMQVYNLFAYKGCSQHTSYLILKILT